MVAPGKNLKGLSVIEYCTMCIYYDSQPYPSNFIADAIEESDDEELDSVLDDLMGKGSVSAND